MNETHIRPARPEDIPALLGLIRELAEFEHLSHLVTCTEADLQDALFGYRSSSAILLFPQGEQNDQQPAGFALYFHNFSTFVGRRGMYVEDLYVQERHRGKGYGKALLVYLAKLAVERNCGRFEWVVLDWNTNAQRFYEALGATVLPDWRITRVTGDALQRMAQLSP